MMMYTGPIDGMTLRDLPGLSEKRIRGLNRDELTHLLTNFESSLSLKQRQVAADVVDKYLESDSDSDDGFVVEKPGSETTVLVESPTVSTTVSSFRAASESSENESPKRSEVAPPRRTQASVDNLDHECTEKRRAKAADDALEFSRALKWIYTVLKLENLPADAESRPEECFGEQLRDGVLLCNLLNALKPGTIGKISNSTNAFGQMSNITSFLRGCQKIGVHKRDCFDSVDLQQLRDLSRVYETLLAVSRAVQKNVPDYSGEYLVSMKREARLRKSHHQQTPKIPTQLPPMTTPNRPSSASTRSESNISPAPASPSVSEISSATTTKFPTSIDQVTTLADLIKEISFEKYSRFIYNYADDLDDLKEMTDNDFDTLVTDANMPLLKARRFKKALIDLGANLAPPK